MSVYTQKDVPMHIRYFILEFLLEITLKITTPNFSGYGLASDFTKFVIVITPQKV